MLLCLLKTQPKKKKEKRKKEEKKVFEISVNLPIKEYANFIFERKKGGRT